MKMLNSVCLGLVHRGHCIADDAAKLGVHQLSKAEANPHSRADPRFGRVSFINDGLREGQINQTIMVARLNEGAGHHWLNTIINDDPIDIPYFEGLSCPKNSLHHIRQVNLPPNHAVVMVTGNSIEVQHSNG